MSVRNKVNATPGDGASDERGAIAVIVAMMLVTLLGMAAYAVDLGGGYDARRNAQAAVDIGLLAGAQDVPFSTDQASELIADQIRKNLKFDFTDAEWAAMWTTTNCSDANGYSIKGEVSGVPTNCITFDTTGRARAKLPNIEVDTIFATLFGTDEITITAEAEVFVRFAGIGGVLPFTVLGGAEDGSQICLRSSSTGTAIPPCDGSSSGNFHALEVSVYGDAAFGTDTIPCNTNDNDVFTINIAVGIDHLLRTKTSYGVTDTCAKPFGPNQFYTQTGLGNGLWEGLVAGEWISGSAGLVHFAGRLSNTSTLGDTVIVDHAGTDHVIDNTPIWRYIPPGFSAGTDVPASCTRETFEALEATSVDDANANIGVCLDDYNDGDYTDAEGNPANDYLPMLTHDADADGFYDIESNPRFAIVPQIAEETLPRGRKVVTVSGFKAVWVQGLYFPGGTSGDVLIEPGESAASVTIPNGGSPLDQVTGWLLPDSTVEAVIGLLDEAGGEVNGSNVIDLIN